MKMHSKRPALRGSRGIRLSVLFVLGGVIVLGAQLVGAFTVAADVGKWVAPASASSKKNPVPTTDASLQVGKKIYTKECASCHGKKGAGDGPKAVDLTKAPGNFTTAAFQSQTDGAIFWKMTQGNKPMPAFKTAYTEEERWSVVDYIRTLGK
jgi:mono/diheme cytochrome c family protein